MYYGKAKVKCKERYLLLALDDVPEEVHIGGLQLGQECMAVLCEEVVELSLSLELLMQLLNVDLHEILLIHGCLLSDLRCLVSLSMLKSR